MSFLILAPMIIVFSISLSEYAASVPPYKMFFGFDKNLNELFFNPIAENYRIFFEDSIYIKAFLNSLKFALLTTAITLLIGYPAALSIANSSDESKNILLTLIILPFWTSLIIRVYAWKIILGQTGILNNFLLYIGFISEPIQFLNSEGAVIAGLVYCYLPFMIFPLYVAIERMDKSLIEAAQDLGYSPLQAFFKITLPLSKEGIIAGCLLVFIPVVGEYVVPDLLGGGKIINVGKIIWIEFFQNKDWPIASAITIILAIIFVIPLIIIQRFIEKEEEDEETI
ncbi:MAG: ABC transporter permease [Rickettsiales bacterium]